MNLEFYKSGRRRSFSEGGKDIGLGNVPFGIPEIIPVYEGIFLDGKAFSSPSLHSG
jgi:hypothetical protein